MSKEFEVDSSNKDLWKSFEGRGSRQNKQVCFFQEVCVGLDDINSPDYVDYSKQIWTYDFNISV